MPFLRLVSVRALALSALVAAGFASVEALAGPAVPKEEPPSPTEVAALLQREPITTASWPQWRRRMLDWFPSKTHNADEAYIAGRQFFKQQADTKDQLPAPFERDFLAWYLLGGAIMDELNADSESSSLARAEKILRQSLQLNPVFAASHMRLGIVLLMQADRAAKPSPTAVRTEGQRELTRARELDPTLPIKAFEAAAAMRQGKFSEAERLFQDALSADPGDVNVARNYVYCLLANQQHSGPRAPLAKPIVDRFPQDGVVICLYGAALAFEGDPRAARREFNRVRDLGTDPSKVLSADLVKQIDEAAALGWMEIVGLAILGFAAFYAVVMLAMAATGLLLSTRTRGANAHDLLGSQEGEWVAAGQVVRTSGESLLSRLYALALCGGLVLFYLSIPFVIVGLLAGTGVLLYFVFSLPRIPIKLIVILVVVGLGAAWAVLKSVFAAPAKGSFGIAKTPAQCPRLYDALTDVAHRVDTEPVNQVYIAPGSAIGVHQEGRGPFGMFGVKNRVLTLGLSTMHYLTVGELKAILAHEYVHFSHADTFYSRFIYQVQMSIQEALKGMGQTGGAFKYVNPFYWFLHVYYKAYSLLSAGYSRSREYLADRMACTLYGPDPFVKALTKVSTDGSLFEMTIYQNIHKLLSDNKTFVNMYSSFREFRDQQLTSQEREELYQKLLGEKESLFASHPTFKERADVVAQLPQLPDTDPSPALSLFENMEELEQELTDFLTGYIQYVQHLQSQASAQG